MRIYVIQVAYVFIFSFILFPSWKLHFLTAAYDLEEFISTEENFLNSLDLYLKNEEERLQRLKRKREEFARVHGLAKKDGEQFIANPVNKYLLVKRLTSDLYETFQLVDSPYNRDVFKKEASKIMIYPEEKDLIGAADSLLKLQEFYSLNTSEMARGQIEGAVSSTELTAEDSFILGLRAYKNKKWQQSLFWMQESLNILDNKTDANVFHKIEILVHMANVHNSLKNYTAAAEVSEKILQLDPNHVQAKGNLKFYRTQEASAMETSRHENKQGFVLNEQVLNSVDAFSTLCRGKKIRTPDEEKQLSCYFASNNNRYFLLHPTKVEVLNLKPLLLMYHDVLKNGEAEILKALVYPKFTVSPIPIRSSEKPRCNRTSKSALFQNSEHSIVATISKRLQDIIGINDHPDAPLQVVKFESGGYYDPHLDFEPMNEQQMGSEMGYVLATWLVFLNDVISGGSTVFTDIGVEIKPVKGAALFWFNFHKNGTGDEVTKHADCPVLVGSKWVVNKRLHAYGNEFIRKCSTNQLE